MKHLYRQSLVLLAALAAGGCAWTSQELHVRPAPHPPPISVGEGRAVSLDVVDTRGTAVIGRRAFGVGGGKILVGDDLVGVVRDELSRGLRQLGFKPKERLEPGAARLRVEIRQISYSVTQGMAVAVLHVGVAIHASCTGGNGDLLERLYDGEDDEHLVVAQSASQNEHYVSDALTQALEQLLRDDALTGCLATAA
jgi:uncharacterized lipoprotein YajG